MKVINKILFLLLLSVSPALAWKETGGGDEVALDFQRAFAGALRSVQEGKISGKFTADQLLEMAQKSKILVVEERLTVGANGTTQESIAVNEPSSALIRINRTRWTGLQDVRLKEAVAFHEILSLLGLERTGYYEYSAKYLEKFGLSPWEISGGEASRAKDPRPRTLSCEINYFDPAKSRENREILKPSAPSREINASSKHWMMAELNAITGDGHYQVNVQGTAPFASPELPRPYEYISIMLKDRKTGIVTLVGPMAPGLAKENSYHQSLNYNPPLANRENDLGDSMIDVQCSFE